MRGRLIFTNPTFSPIAIATAIPKPATRPARIILLIWSLLASRQQFENPWDDRVLFLLGNLPQDVIQLLDQIEQFAHALSKMRCGFILFCQCQAFLHCLHDWLDFALLTLSRNAAEHSPDVLFALEVLLPVSFDKGTANHSPVNEAPQVHVGVATADTQFFHYVIRRKRFLADHQ